MILFIAALVGVVLFLIGFAFGKAGRDELSKQNADAVVELVDKVENLRKTSHRFSDALEIAVGALKDIEKGMPASNLSANSALNSIRALEYKESNE